MNVSRKIKLVLVLPFNLKFGEGLSNVCMAYARHIPRDRFDVTVVQTDFYKSQRVSQDAIDKTMEGIPVHTLHRPDAAILRHLPRGAVGMFYSLFVEPLVFISMRRQMRRVFPEVGSSDYTYLFNNNLRFLFHGIRQIGSTHSWIPDGKGALSRSYHMFRMRIWGLSRYHAFPGHEAFFDGVKGISTFIMPNGVEPELYWPHNPEDADKTRILYVSRLEMCKGLEILPDAWQNVTSDKVLLRIVGTGNSQGIAEKMAMNDPRVSYLGVLEKQSLIEEYRSSDILVFPSRCDTFGLVVLEGISAGLFCIVDESLRKVFSSLDEETVVFTRHDPADLSSAIKASLDEILKIRANREKIHSTATEKYSWGNVIVSLENFIKEDFSSS